MLKYTSAMVGVVAGLATSSLALAQQVQVPNCGPHMWSGGWHGWFLGPIMMIVFIAVAIVVVVFLLRWLGGTGQGAAQHAHATGRTPLDILKERFAKGEIDKEEFEERRRVLGE
ncbi:MAG: SHOCT domain-containing protein [Alphaproteobacteria bacterium]|nr:SHOCT domain-containing protein [Alphaproteobacteria bacterium]